ncbi:helix-turn-helix domain-containing protein [Niabella beijingensis]|uniref:helix-turn-helix domain-containing protein n=1 Tax=Niabella beijingensis TaxID=2872700 RepID=UPI001CC10096|nr:helix-turn-helix transcriptional regulator [Niabella beijingensis]MBZ4187812.1 helix-turn-helix domain-containing protein [Niabella beijingensis]
MEAPQNHSVTTIETLQKENEIKDDIAFKRVEGASRVENFRAPDCYVILLFEKCSGLHSIDFREYAERDLQVHISFPGQIHSWNTNADTSGYKLYISKRLMDTFIRFETHLSQGRPNGFPVLDLNEKTFAKLKSEFIAIERDLNSRSSDTPLSIIITRAQLIVLMVSHLIEVRKGEEMRQARVNPVVLKFQALIENNYMRRRSVNYYADQLTVSSNYLNILCRKYYKLSAKEVIMKRVFLEAKRLLWGTNMSIKEITFKLGFSDQAHFSSFIKRITGLTPKTYKNSVFFSARVNSS